MQRLQLASQLQSAGDLEAAGRLCLDILQGDPADVQARHLLGVLALQRGQLDDAAHDFEQVLHREPGNPDALVNLGIVRQQQGRYPEALDAMRHALRIAPAREDIHYNLGNALSGAGRWHEAEEAYLQALSLNPDNALFHYNLGSARHHQGRLEEAAAAYLRATEVNGNYLEAWTNHGIVLRELGRIDEALKSFRAALALYPEDMTLQRNVRSALKQQLPGWHWPMLADEKRNGAYQQAIARAVDADSIVLDIGTGSGLLAMMAARAGARQVVACEISAPLADAASEVVRCNGLEKQVTVINRKSTDLRIGEDLQQAANLLVSEIVDVGLLGEGVLPSIRHALQHLACPDARVIPCGATVYARLVEAPGLRRVNPVTRISGFDLSALDRFRLPGDYLDVRLEQTAHGFLSDTMEVAHFDFAAPPPFISEQAPVCVDLTVRATASGTLHGVAFWFDLHLDDAITLSTAPTTELDAWGQALQFLDADRAVTQGEDIHLQALLSDTRIEYRLAPDRPGETPGEPEKRPGKRKNNQEGSKVNLNKLIT